MGSALPCSGKPEGAYQTQNFHFPLGQKKRLSLPLSPWAVWPPGWLAVASLLLALQKAPRPSSKEAFTRPSGKARRCGRDWGFVAVRRPGLQDAPAKEDICTSVAALAFWLDTASGLPWYVQAL